MHFNEHWQRYQKGERINLCVTLASLSIVSVLLYGFQPASLYTLQLVAFIPIVWFAYRYGWLGTMLYTCSLMILMLIKAYQAPDDILLSFQPYIISYSLVAIFVGCLVEENNQFRRSINLKNKELIASNQSLIKLNKRNVELLKEMQNIQEKERKMLASALHDELGQNITAFQVVLQAQENKNQNKNSQLTTLLKQSTDAIYESVYDLLHWLRPRILDDQGLEKALTSDYFAKKLANANIHYHSNLEGDLTELNDAQSTAIFRIVQEAVTNCIKHSNAKHFYVSCNLSDQLLTLELRDDGSEHQYTSTSLQKGGFGLIGISERVEVLSGEVDIKIDNGFKIRISLPVESQS